MTESAEKCKPFPWRCPHCGRKEIRPRATRYTLEVKHDGRLHEVTVEDFEIPTCDACGEKVFSNREDERISQALRAKLGLLTPNQIRDKLRELGLSQKQAAARLGIAEATLSRWMTGSIIQSRAMDNLLRVYFAFPEVRRALSGVDQDAQLGLQPAK